MPALRLPQARIAPRVIDAVEGALPGLVAAFIVSILIVTFQPFSAGSVLLEPGQAAGGNRINQIGYSLLAVTAVASLALLADPRRLWRMVAPSWALIAVVFALAILNSPERGAALRSTAFSMAAVIAMVSAVMLLRSERSLQNVVASAALAVLGLSYFGVVVLPEAARHTAELFEPANEGLWRGIYPHKNIAGPVMAAMVFSGVFLMRGGRRLLGLCVFIAAVFFLLQSGSKTSAGTVAMVLMAVLLPSLFGLRGLGLAAALTLIALFGLATNGTVLFEPIGALNKELAPGNTYTGRIALWEFALEKIGERPWTGYGLNALWGQPAVMQMERPYDADWDFRGIVHGHSGYFDAVLDFGLFGAAAVIFVVVIQPMIDYARCRLTRANVIAADFFLMIVLFAALNAFMETFFFRRGDPVWMLMVFGLAGLRLVATEPLKRG
ncbi:MAG: O-antigen ligase family protein [Rhizobiaceae bacterium]|nr:O-antigen ligase family protein [Rhizobiaceae bacterium]